MRLGLLLTDGVGPTYASWRPGALADRAVAALAALPAPAHEFALAA